MMIENALVLALKTHIRSGWKTWRELPLLFGPLEPVPPGAPLPYMTLAVTHWKGDQLQGSGYGAGSGAGVLHLWSASDHMGVRTDFCARSLPEIFSFERMSESGSLSGQAAIRLEPGFESLRKDKHYQTTRTFLFSFAEDLGDAEHR